MTKKEHIKYWINSADNDFEVMNYLFDGGKYVYSLFFGHLYLEKLCKALWVNNNIENAPPKIHNLVLLIKQANINMNDEDLLFMDLLNEYQIATRYPDYIDTMIKKCNKTIANDFIIKIKSLGKCFKEMLQLN